MSGGPLLAQCGAAAAATAATIRPPGGATALTDLRGAHLLLQQVYPAQDGTATADRRSDPAQDSVKESSDSPLHAASAAPSTAAFRGLQVQHEDLLYRTLYYIILLCSIKLPGIGNMRSSIESNLGDKLADCQRNGRMLLPKVCYQTPDGLQTADIILYMTDAPCDEYFADSLRPNLKLKTELSNYRLSLKHKDAAQSSIP